MKRHAEIRISVLSVILVSFITVFVVLKSADELEVKWVDDQLTLLQEYQKGPYLDLDNPEVKWIMSQGEILWKEKISSGSIVGFIVIGIYCIFVFIFLFRIRKRSQ